MGLSPPNHHVFSSRWQRKHRKYSWHQKGCIAVSESTRWGYRLLHHTMFSKQMKNTKSIGNTATTRKAASLLVSQWVNKMELSPPIPCRCVFCRKKRKTIEHKKYSWHRKVVAVSESTRWGCRLLPMISVFPASEKSKHRKYSWHQKGGLAVSESTRWCCRLLPIFFPATEQTTHQEIQMTTEKRHRR